MTGGGWTSSLGELGSGLGLAGDVLVGLLAGLGSALLPLVNAEAWLALRSHSSWVTLLLIAMALAVGQTAGKVVLFEAARRGRAWHGRRRESGAHRALPSPSPRTLRRRALQQRVTARLSDPRTAGSAILASAALGLPPLAFTSVSAGALGTSRRQFAALCLLGRLARFVVLALGLGVLSWG